MFIKLAFKNMFRRKSRTFLVVLMIALSLVGLLFLQGLYDGMLKQMVRSTIRSDAGEIVIFNKGFRSSKQVKDYIDHASAIIQQLEDSGIDAQISKRILIDGVVSNGRSTRSTTIIGISTVQESNVSNFKEGITKGEYLKEDDTKGVLVGIGLAKNMNLKIGSKVVLSGQESDGSIASVAVRVRGLYQTNNPMLDKNAVVVVFNKAKSVFSTGDRVGTISINLEEDIDIDLAAKDIDKITGGMFDVLTWKDQYPRLEIMRESLKMFNSITYTIVFLVVALGIMDIMMISVLERMREFGILLSIGTKFINIAQMIIVESIFIGIVGLFLGSLLGGGILLIFSLIGVDLSIFSQGLEMFGISAVIYPVLKFEYFNTAFISVLIASSVSALLPIYILSRKKPVEMVNYH